MDLRLRTDLESPLSLRRVVRSTTGRRQPSAAANRGRPNKKPNSNRPRHARVGGRCRSRSHVRVLHLGHITGMIISPLGRYFKLMMQIATI